MILYEQTIKEAGHGQPLHIAHRIWSDSEGARRSPGDMPTGLPGAHGPTITGALPGGSWQPAVKGMSHRCCRQVLLRLFFTLFLPQSLSSILKEPIM